MLFSSECAELVGVQLEGMPTWLPPLCSRVFTLHSATKNICAATPTFPSHANLAIGKKQIEYFMTEKCY
jgi:hypothetical protein